MSTHREDGVDDLNEWIIAFANSWAETQSSVKPMLEELLQICHLACELQRESDHEHAGYSSIERWPLVVPGTED